MKKILLVATVQSHIAQFHKPLIQNLKEKGYIVDVAAKDNLKEKNGLKIDMVDNIYNIPFSRSPINKSNIEAYKQLKKLILENKYDIVHCNTPMGGILTRLVKRNVKNLSSKIIYTAHGFHFYKGAPIKNWLIYYPIEKYFSKYTDTIITINEEDYQVAKNKFKAKSVYKINSTGINIEKFKIELSKEEKENLKKELKIDNNDFVIVCIGELNKNKNQIMQIKAMENIAKKYKNVQLFLLGNGPLKEYYEEEIARRKLQNNIILLGYRTDVNKILNLANCAISTSIREGLGVNIIEAMASGTPVIATINRGHSELIQNAKNGYLVDIGNVEQLEDKMSKIIEKNNKEIIENEKKEAEKYSEANVKKQLEEIYRRMI